MHDGAEQCELNKKGLLFFEGRILEDNARIACMYSLYVQSMPREWRPLSIADDYGDTTGATNDLVVQKCRLDAAQHNV